MSDPLTGLRILIADENQEHLTALAEIVNRIGHEVVGRVIDTSKVASAAEELDPDVALVVLGPGAEHEHALVLIEEIVREASSPVIALLETTDAEYTRQAASRGVFACITDTSDAELAGAIDTTLRRFNEYHALQGAFGRRAVIEQAKGILMERHGIGSQAAFNTMRMHANESPLNVAGIAQQVIDAHATFLMLAPSARAEISATAGR